MERIVEISDVAACDDAVVKVTGALGTGKTEALIARVAHLIEGGVDPARILVVTSTLNAVDALSARLEQRAGAAAAAVRVITPQRYFVDLLDTPEAREATGRIPRILTDFERNILMEDMKVVGLKVKRLREMTKFFFRSWTELADDDPDFLLDAEERTVHGFLKRHLELRGAMLPCELSNIAFHFLNEHPDVADAARFDYVLADDYQNYGKATGMVLAALARTQFVAAGNPNEQIDTVEPYPYLPGLDELGDTEGCTCLRLEQADPECAPAIIDIGNALVTADDMDASITATSRTSATGRHDGVRMVAWTTPNDEFMGIARYLKHRLMGGDRTVHARELYVAVPNAVWGKAVAKVLEANDIPFTRMVSHHALSGDPRKPERSAGLRAFNALNLVAHPDDASAWRDRCGFGDYLTHSNHWCRLEDYAFERECGVIDVLDLIASADDPASIFLGADILAAAYREGRALLDRLGDKRGFNLVNGLLPGEKPPAAFMALLEPLTGAEDADELFARVCDRMETRFADTDAVRIGLPQMACGQSFDSVVLMGAVDGFYPGFDTFGTERDEDVRAALRAEDRRAIYALLGKARREVVVSTFRKDTSEAAAVTGMWSNRIRMEDGTSMALLTPSSFIGEMGDAAPAFESSLTPVEQAKQETN